MLNVLRRNRRVVAAAAAVVVVPLVGLTAPASATSSFALTRLAGADRYGTADQIATTAFGSANTAILATGQNYPDALAAAYLAGGQTGGAPILLTTTHDPVPSSTFAALGSLKVKSVIIVGGANAVGNDVQSTLSSTASSNAAGGDLTVTRIAGATRYDTMQAIDTAPGLSVGTFQGKNTAFIATGQDFPDALGAGPVAFADHFPIILTNPTSLSSQASATLSALHIQQVLILGGTAAVSAAVESSINAMAIPTLQRFSGADRSQTSTLLADYAVSNLGFKATGLNVASGAESYGGADALAAASLGGEQQVPSLVTDSPGDPGYDLNYAAEHASTLVNGYALGGALPLPDTDVQGIESAGGSTSANPNISLTSTSVNPGGTLSGTVTSPSTVSAVTATGCGLSNQAVAFAPSTGAFTLTIPSTQPVGSCQLIFSVAFNNGGATAQDTFAISVTNTTGALPAPTLSTVAVTSGTGSFGATDSAVFTFDEPLTAAVPPATDFRIYRQSGEFAAGQGSPTASGMNAWQVTFPAGSVTDATLGSVAAGAVVSATGSFDNFASSVAVAGAAPGSTIKTNEADLTSVGAATTAGATQYTQTFTFDAPVVTASSTVGGTTYCVPTPLSASTGKFESLEQTGGTADEATSPPPYTQILSSGGTCSPGSTVTATFADPATTVPVVGGAVQAGRVIVNASDTVGNPIESQVSTSSTPLFPVLLSATEDRVAGSTSEVAVHYTFTPTQNVTAGTAADFFVIRGDGSAKVAQSITTTGSTVTADFNGPDIAGAVAVAASAGAAKNATDTAPDQSAVLGPLAGSSGQVQLPQLISVTVTPASAPQGPTVTYTFDKPFTTAPTGADFFLYTQDGGKVASAGTAAGTLSTDMKSVSFACNLGVTMVCATGGFTTSQTQTAAAGTVADQTATDNPPLVVEQSVVLTS